jgi:hypothetical protein
MSSLQEAALGDIKENKGIRGFITRGIQAVKAELNIICAAMNMKSLDTSQGEKGGKRSSSSRLFFKKRLNYQFC